MANVGRKIGINVFILMQNTGLSLEKLAEELNCSYRDMCRILEGRLMLQPVELEKIANLFGKTKRELLHYEMDKFIPELQYMKEFSNIDNLDKILDLLDEYIELKETM